LAIDELPAGAVLLGRATAQASTPPAAARRTIAAAISAARRRPSPLG